MSLKNKNKATNMTMLDVWGISVNPQQPIQPPLPPQSSINRIRSTRTNNKMNKVNINKVNRVNRVNRTNNRMNGISESVESIQSNSNPNPLRTSPSTASTASPPSTTPPHSTHNITNDGFNKIPRSLPPKRNNKNIKQQQQRIHLTPPNHTNTNYMKSKPILSNKPTPKPLQWLNAPNSSLVLDRNEIISILDFEVLTGRDRQIAVERRNNILLICNDSNCMESEARRWSGLCKYDDPDRLIQCIGKLEAAKKSFDEEVVILFRVKEPSKQQSQRRTQCVVSLKDMVRLLDDYRVSLKLAREIYKNLKQQQRNYKKVQQQQQQQRQQQQQQQPQQQQKPNTKWWSFGRSKDEWNYCINPEFATLFRGHHLNEQEYEQYAKLQELDYFESINDDETDDDDDDDDDNNDNEMDFDYSSNVSLLGAACKRPPGLEALRRFQGTCDDQHKTRFVTNLKLLYGDDWEQFVGVNGKYRAHLLSSYNILHRVGSGVYGQVFKAKTKKTHKIVAIKSLQLILRGKQKENQDIKIKQQALEIQNRICPYMMSEGMPVPVIREIMSLKQLNHINITKLYDIVLNDPSQCDNLSDSDPLRQVTIVPYNKYETKSTQWNLHLVQEFVPNELYAIMRNLKILNYQNNKMFCHEYKSQDVYSENLKASSMPTYPHWFKCEHVKSIIFDILTGLTYLKEQSYVHRDLKPANLLLTDDGIIKIADFGLSRPKYKSHEPLTNAHNVVTRYYRAPEILVEQNKRESSYGFASDMWSLGAIFAELIIGRPIFRANTDLEQIFYIIHKCGSINDQCWPGISSVLTQDPPDGFLPKDPKTGKKNIWHEGERKYNFIKNMRVEYRNKPRNLAGFLKPYIATSWSHENQKCGLDLIEKMLCYDPNQRITAKQALQHQWFKISPYAEKPKDIIRTAKKAKKSSHTDLQKQQQQKQHQRQQQLQQQQQRQQQQQLLLQQQRSSNTQSLHGGGDNHHRGFMNQRGGSSRRGVIGHNIHRQHHHHHHHHRHHHQQQQQQHHHQRRGGRGAGRGRGRGGIGASTANQHAQFCQNARALYNATPSISQSSTVNDQKRSFNQMNAKNINNNGLSVNPPNKKRRIN